MRVLVVYQVSWSIDGKNIGPPVPHRYHEGAFRGVAGHVTKPRKALDKVVGFVAHGANKGLLAGCFAYAHTLTPIFKFV